MGTGVQSGSSGDTRVERVNEAEGAEAWGARQKD